MMFTKVGGDLSIRGRRGAVVLLLLLFFSQGVLGLSNVVTISDNTLLWIVYLVLLIAALSTLTKMPGFSVIFGIYGTLFGLTLVTATISSFVSWVVLGLAVLIGGAGVNELM